MSGQPQDTAQARTQPPSFLGLVFIGGESNVYDMESDKHLGKSDLSVINFCVNKRDGESYNKAHIP